MHADEAMPDALLGAGLLEVRAPAPCLRVDVLSPGPGGMLDAHAPLDYTATTPACASAPGDGGQQWGGGVSGDEEGLLLPYPQQPTACHEGEGHAGGGRGGGRTGPCTQASVPAVQGGAAERLARAGGGWLAASLGWDGRLLARL